MKCYIRTATITAFSVVVLLAACTEKDTLETSGEEAAIEPVRVVLRSTLQERDGVHYEAGQSTPFTGIAESFHANKKQESRCHYEEGRLHGPSLWCYPSGQKRVESFLHEGKLHGVLKGWYQNGQQKTLWHYHHGKIHGVAKFWDEMGELKAELNYKDGKQVGM